MILKDLPDALHVLCIAPQKSARLPARRARRHGTRRSDEAHAESDRARGAFYRKFWKVDVEDPKLYDVTIDTSRLSYEVAAEVVAAAARAK